MQDLETKSLWSQITGECISGPREGKVLELYPSMHTTYSEFKELFPGGLLLRKPSRGEAGSHYNSYFADSTKLGIFGRADNFARLRGKDQVFGLRLSDKTIAVSKDYLIKNGFVTLADGDTPVVLSYDNNSKTAVAFALNGVDAVDPTKLKVKGNRILPGEGKSSWHAATGRSNSADTPNLTMIPVITAYWFAWISFFPNTELIK